MLISREETCIPGHTWDRHLYWKRVREEDVGCERCDAYNPHTDGIATRGSIFAACYFRECSKSTVTSDVNVDYGGGSSVVIKLITRLCRVRKGAAILEPRDLFLLWRFTTRAFNGTEWRSIARARDRGARLPAFFVAHSNFRSRDFIY